MPQVRLLVLITALIGATATLLVSVLPFLGFAYRSESAHVAIETAASLIAMLAAYLVFWRYRVSGRLPHLMLAAALTVLAFTNLAFSTVPSLVQDTGEGFRTWAPVGGRLLGAVLFAVAAFAADRPVVAPRRAARTALLGSLAGLFVIGAIAAIVGDSLPQAIEPQVSPEGSHRPRIVGNEIVLALQLVAMILYAAAAAGFTRRAERTGDELMLWVALAATLGAFARLNYFLFPSLYSDWVYTGDVLRLGFFLLLFVGVARELSAHERTLGTAVAFEERRRIARNLHDGLAQELAFILGEARRIAAGDPKAEDLRHLGAAAERALDESRDAIAVLTRPMDEPLDMVIAQAAEDVAVRAGLSVRLRLAEGVSVAHPAREALARIVREAVTNAAKHGRADRVDVELSATSGVRITVRDDGVGFDPRSVEPDVVGFGLRSMRERAEALGGQVSIRSAPGEGTEVEVILP